jgi:teichuronic acid biosynthesis glycosyltransferase TuaH
MTDLVVLSLEAWDEVWRRNQHLVAGLLRRGAVQRVLFVEPAVDSLHELRRGRRPRGSAVGLRRILLPGLAGRELWALRPRKVLPRRLDPRGDRRRARAVVRTAHRLGMDSPLLWVNDPGGAEVLAATAWPSLYDITDDWLVADRPPAELARLRRQEQDLLDSCKEVVVCSPALQRAKSGERSLVLIPNAVDLDAYRTRAPRPADLPDGPVALYLGTVHRDRVDVDLCVATAHHLAAAGASRSAASLVLVGPAPLPSSDLVALRKAGVHVLGPRPSEHVPAYLQHADVLVVPHLLTEFTASLDPIKAYEYRAARRPVVSTAVPGFQDVRDPLVTTATSVHFAGAVAAAVATPVEWSPNLPSDLPDWSTRVGEMTGVITSIAGGETPP